MVTVPTDELPLSTPSTNHRSVPVPPDSVAVTVWGCEVVTAESLGERETVTLEDGGGGVDGGVDGGGVDGVLGVDEVPPPHPIIAK